MLVASSDAEELVHLCDRVLVFRSGAVAAELRGTALTEERLVAETLGATSHRKNLRIGREPIRVTVLRPGDRSPAVPPSSAPPATSPPADDRPPLGRFGRLLRAVTDRWRTR